MDNPQLQPHTSIEITHLASPFPHNENQTHSPTTPSPPPPSPPPTHKNSSNVYEDTNKFSQTKATYFIRYCCS